MAYLGTIIEESLSDKSVLADMKITSTKVEPVTEEDKHQTPWIKQWTLHKVEISDEKAQAIAGKLSRLIDKEHAQAWYVDFKTDTEHYIIFLDKVFHITDRTDKAQYDEAINYGIAFGIPRHQMDVPSWRK